MTAKYFKFLKKSAGDNFARYSTCHKIESLVPELAEKNMWIKKLKKPSRSTRS